MFQFIKQSSLSTIKIKLIILYILNISDILLTLILVRTGLIIEANPVMASIIENSFATFFVKGIIPALLFIYLYYRLQSATPKMIKLTNFCIFILLGFYFFINCLHLLWFILLPYF
ncbi:hypothetical protein GMA92_01475 [Turicibacter sanguinis]|uniref:DUF5658 domain-containing protein n=2 Tax=Turicibacter sanguinis TaxID=154288 RepID=A0A9X4XCH3_9FIRM|nr:DUF5658 family protein [Turicibacter sanguinis]EFF63620.1 hypothetical protein CUW_0939 [Turicibacter sanguinis PC909]MCU7189997.1 DUF5658 family protein [Turicibacter sanguinis]MCU7211488.1 DUF5658 family protein [Turicibacter sanguinis]MDB8437980.1 DUF5658 family protein [Turicibacter sanguinis]MDB8574165.1 DUF5658 family protein [Turicibacter sanguinis]